MISERPRCSDSRRTVLFERRYRAFPLSHTHRYCPKIVLALLMLGSVKDVNAPDWNANRRTALQRSLHSQGSPASMRPAMTRLLQGLTATFNVEDRSYPGSSFVAYLNSRRRGDGKWTLVDPLHGASRNTIDDHGTILDYCDILLTPELF